MGGKWWWLCGRLVPSPLVGEGSGEGASAPSGRAAAPSPPATLPRGERGESPADHQLPPMSRKAGVGSRFRNFLLNLSLPISVHPRHLRIILLSPYCALRALCGECTILP